MGSIIAENETERFSSEKNASGRAVGYQPNNIVLSSES